MRKICIVTGTRAEYGILKRLMYAIQEDVELELQVVATNMHLSPEFGATYKEILADGFTINRKVEMLLSSDTANATCKSVGLGTIGFADAYEDLKPDLIVVLGDRYEILAAVTTALLYRIPVAHISGGEITEGAYDDAIRNAITKMSHLHFTATEEYRKRVIQMGEQPDLVFNVGAMGVDSIRYVEMMSKAELEESIGFALNKPSALITFHPVTLDCNTNSAEQFGNLLQALTNIPGLNCLFTYPNSDTDGRILIQMIHDFVEKNKHRATSIASLGQKRYFSALKVVDVVIGNSSSGIVEVPSFKIPTVNIGIRQKGRIQADSTINCSPLALDVENAIKQSLTAEFKQKALITTNPYHTPDTVNQILQVLRNTDLNDIVIKHFYDL